jgi:hypothetical protein
MITQSTIEKGKENTVADKSSQLSDVSNNEEYLTAVEEYGSSADNIQTLDTTVSGQVISESLNTSNPSLKVIPRDDNKHQLGLLGQCSIPKRNMQMSKGAIMRY